MSEQVIYSPLSKYLSVIRNGTVSTQVSEITEFPVTRIETIADGTIDLSKIGYLADKISTYKLKKWDILYSHINSFKHVGKVAQYEGGKDLYHGMNLLLLRPNEHIDPKYLYYSLSSSQAKRYAQKECQKAINQVSLNTKTVGAYEFYVPPIYEQKVIAKILYTLDTQIRQTEAIIAKLQQVKQGLLHDLLTRGIDANGQLRPPYEQASELYRDSPLGWIPKEWEIISLGDIASRSFGTLQTGPFGSQLHAYEYVSEGIPVIMPQDLNGEQIDANKIAYITEERAKKLGKHRVTSNDVVFSRRGDLSRCVAINESEAGWVCGTGCLLVRLPKSEILGEWLSLTYKQAWSQKQIEGMAVGSTMPNLNTSILAKFIIAKPPADEQRSILDFYVESEKRQHLEQKTLAKRKQQKFGLMDDLLTGRKQVTELIEQQQQAS
ncbi:hypothetical protein HVA01_21750 [Halovibrio variabilis]|uniref:Type I restriction modification DNA specificity domain-containing protein n=1 Tax=Halovibrio variabilis TaxID=31910 RepID=A0A511UPJ1_9GAMM|nr:restriction endonuclease subunit S [Halovibrio variabilis]GEN28529.1 hypothetical protein HVA01_21750 [Halovibrio variabilis]